ncbi:hypothetical protein CQ12_06320 [Bradyrhizobium jicamae]|uniref:MurNAc-LAA domain-containing protein n=1 Tax=Bradyrhizobium jicamae TaxID=280332 RepID=A0A0R3LY32_9BRAD|nr:N-acetylmuramoyl-L-alanine amidase [Bradyrhizobium jicamae]KRR10019.1 hypothetical protein CQ12_06320 [Bradyrhizobium jicamae]
MSSNDVDDNRRLIGKLRQELAAREAAARVEMTQELEIEIDQRRRYIDELMGDLQELEMVGEASGTVEFDAAEEASANPNGLAIVIGHSSEGTDKGALGVSPPFPAAASAGRAEYYWNEDLARRIEEKANARGIRVATFRRRQNGTAGVRDAYRLVARWRPQASVELHFNSATASARGSETLYGRSGSIPWARALQDKLVSLYGRVGLQDRGLKDANETGRGIASLTNEVQPSALIEPFFGSNQQDAELGIARKDGLARAVVDAFAALVGLPAPASLETADAVAADVESAEAATSAALWNSLQQAYATATIEFPHLKDISFSQWALESGTGTSQLATRHLNFAGMKWRPFMSGIATKVWYEAHDGGEFYCKFASLEDFIAGYWLRLDRHPSYRGWRGAAAAPERFLNFIADIWAPPAENPNYKPKVMRLYDQFRGTFGAPPADAPAEIPSDEDFWVDRSPEDEIARQSVESMDATVTRARSQSTVSWARDADCCDYAHLGADLPVGMQFPFTAADIEMLCALNDFPVGEAGVTPVLFGLRGATIVSGGSGSDGLWREEAVLKNIRPNHQETRCVMGVWDRQQGKIAVYSGSTVPHAEAVVSWFRTREAGNLLPSGLYRYICGEHNGRPGCFLLRKSIASKRKVIVRRTADDLTYESGDIFQNMAPGDNIHPSFSSESGWFSSFGCQVIIGSATSSGQHSGQWAKFRRSAGLLDANGEPGRPYLYLLLTGDEVLMASEARRRGRGLQEMSGLRRLRFGSQGARVTRLQDRLGIAAPDGDFGPATAEALHNRQRTRTQRSDGIFTPALDTELDWSIFAPEA